MDRNPIVAMSSLDQLLGDMFPKARVIQWTNGQPSLRPGELVDSPFKALVKSQEYSKRPSANFRLPNEQITVDMARESIHDLISKRGALNEESGKKSSSEWLRHLKMLWRIPSTATNVFGVWRMPSTAKNVFGV